MTEDGGEHSRAPLLLKSNKEAGWLARRVRTSPSPNPDPNSDPKPSPNPNRNSDQVSETLEAEGQVVSNKDGGRASFVDCSVYDAVRNFRLV